MKNSIWIFVLTMLVGASCKTSSTPASNVEYFMFGSAHCHCRENCATLYKYTAAGVVKGNGTSCQPPDYTFGGAAMSADASAKALKLLADIPEGLYASKETTFGCPDCADQGTYHIEVKKGGVVHAWRIDTQDSSLPDFLKPFQQKIRETMEALK